MLSKSLANFLKTENLRDHFMRIFIHLIPEQDTTLYVVNSHLIVEEIVQDLIAFRLADPSSLDDGRFTFHQKSLLLKALYGNAFEPWTYSSIAALNSLRNKCAHFLGHPKPDKYLSDFISSGYDKINEAELQRRRGRGYTADSNATAELLALLEDNAQKQHDLAFRMPMAVERLIECLLKQLVISRAA